MQNHLISRLRVVEVGFKSYCLVFALLTFILHRPPRARQRALGVNDLLQSVMPLRADLADSYSLTA